MSKDELRNFTAYEHWFKLARLTHKISVYADGILTMDKTLMGLIEVNPKDILVDGIRKETLGLSKLLHETFIFKHPGSAEELQDKFDLLKAKFAGMKKAFEYIQDFLNIQGETIWREEISRIFKINLDREKFEHSFEEQNFDIPYYEPVEGDTSPTFLGRILNQILSVTSADKSFYLDNLLHFYDFEGNQVFGIQNVLNIEKEMGTFFIQTLDKLCSFRIMNLLKSLARDYGVWFGSAAITEMMRRQTG